jgi:hypothetical protein
VPTGGTATGLMACQWVSLGITYLASVPRDLIHRYRRSDQRRLTADPFRSGADTSLFYACAGLYRTWPAITPRLWSAPFAGRCPGRAAATLAFIAAEKGGAGR